MGLEYKLRAQLKLNLKLFLDIHMLREGAFINVASGQQFYDGSDMSLLLPDSQADDVLWGVSEGQVWQSPFRQWVYESGVPLDGTNVGNPPQLASGVYIQGAFRGTGDPEFGHTIDYLNGRIIFNSPQPVDLVVQAPFAAREVRVDFEHAFNQQAQQGYLDSKYFTNPLTSMQLVYPSGAAQPFPAVFIEVDDRDFDAYELGNRSAEITDVVKLHVWAMDDMQRDNIVDILTSQWRKRIPIVDWNLAPLPLSGILNTLSPEHVPYQTLLRNVEVVTTVGSGTPVRYITDIDVVRSNNLPAAEEYERSIVTFEVTTRLNAPTTPFGHKWEARRVLPPIQDPGL